MKRRDFLKTSSALGALTLINGRALKGETVLKQKDITYNTFPLWKGFNLQEKFTQKPYVYHIPSESRIEIGSFPLPLEYKGEWRCDLHPRFSPDGKMVCIDSPHEGKGRQLYLIDISQLM